MRPWFRSTCYTCDIGIYLEKGRQNATQIMKDTYAVFLGEQKGQTTNFIWIIPSLIQIYFIVCTQELSCTAELSDKIIK
jgi:hypothetical protein